MRKFSVCSCVCTRLCQSIINSPVAILSCPILCWPQASKDHGKWTVENKNKNERDKGRFPRLRQLSGCWGKWRGKYWWAIRWARGASQPYLIIFEAQFMDQSTHSNARGCYCGRSLSFLLFYTHAIISAEWLHNKHYNRIYSGKMGAEEWLMLMWFEGSHAEFPEDILGNIQ